MRRLSLALCAAATTTLAAPAFAGLINYGDFTGDTVDYRSVSESSPTDPLPLYRAPFISGNSLIFGNLTFGSVAQGAGGVDTTTGLLTTTIDAHAGSAISGLSFHEAGSYTLVGLSNDAAASISAAYIINVLEVDGMAVDPLGFNALMQFDPSDGTYSIGEDGAGSDLWEGNLTVDIDAFLHSHGVFGSATSVSLTLTNTLTAVSQDGTLASIFKKDLSISVLPAPPAALLLVLGAVSGRRRRRN